MQAWNSLLKSLEEKWGKETSQKWLKPIKVISFDARNIYLEFKDHFHKSWFTEHVQSEIEKYLLTSNGKVMKVHLHLKNEISGQKNTAKTSSSDSFYIHCDTLDPSMQLDTFLVSKENTISFQFISDLCKENIKWGAFNPIYLYGKSGVGKTHLLMAIASSLKERGIPYFYVHAEKFTAHVVQAIRLGKMEQFRKAYRHTKVLLVDDIHVLRERWATQEEFFHTFNTLQASGRQIILTGNEPAASLPGIEDRLVSRFEWGIALKFNPLPKNLFPELTWRLAKQLGLPLDALVIDEISHLFSSPYGVVKALHILALRFDLKKPIKELLKDLIEKEVVTRANPEKIIEMMAHFFGIVKEDLLGNSKNREISLPRKLAIYLCRTHLKIPYKKIGRIFSRDHSTVIASIKSIEKKIKEKQDDVMSCLREFQKELS